MQQIIYLLWNLLLLLYICIYKVLLEERDSKEEKRGTFTGALKFDEPVTNATIDDEELDLFEEMIAEAVKRVEVPLIELHEQSSHHMDP